MSKLLKLQIFIAFCMTLITSLYCFIVLSQNEINFFYLSNDEQLFYSCIIINEIFYILTVIYGILNFVWKTVTCCWRDDNEVIQNNFNWKKGFSMIIFMASNITLAYYIYVSPIIGLPNFMLNLGHLFLILIYAIVGESLILYLVRQYINYKDSKKIFVQLLDDNDENNIV